MDSTRGLTRCCGSLGPWSGAHGPTESCSRRGHIPPLEGEEVQCHVTGVKCNPITGRD